MGKPTTETPSYKRLTDADRLTILTLHDKGLTQLAISQRLGRSVSTIHEVIQTYTPTLDMAKRKLAANAERMAENIVINGLPRDHVQVLNGLGVLNQQDSGKLTLIINGLTLAGIGKLETTESVEGEVLSPPLLEAGSEGAQNS